MGLEDPSEDVVHEGSGHYEVCISRTGGDDGNIQAHLMTSEVESGAGSGDDYTHTYSSFMFADGVVSIFRYYRTVFMHRRILGHMLRLLKENHFLNL